MYAERIVGFRPHVAEILSVIHPCHTCGRPTSRVNLLPSYQPGKALRRRRVCVPCKARAERARLVKSGQYAAHKAVRLAVLRGAMQPVAGQACADCNGPATEYEHRDYGKPLDVVPICRRCNIRRGPAKWAT